MIDLDWWSVERGAKVEIHFEQRQPGQPFVLPVEIALALDDGSTMRQVVNLSQRSTSVTLPTPSRVLAVMLDPDFHLLIWRPEYGPRPQH